MIFFAGGVLLVGVAVHIAWIAKRAEAKGRSPLGWALLGVALACLGGKVGLGLFESAEALSSSAGTILRMTAPITLSLGPLVLVALVLMVVPVRVRGGNRWPVFNTRDGIGTLVIADGTVELRWSGRTDHIPRGALKAIADQESVRLAWPDREMLVMPAGKPANREGRMRQAEALAARLTR